MQDQVNNGGPAFPVPHTNGHDGRNGMSLRDYFAAKALQGMAASGYWADSVDVDDGNLELVARNAYAIADAMLRARGAQ